jgi:CcmD family protein
MSVILEAGAAIYVALIVALSVWIGIFIYLWRLDAQARELRHKLDNMPNPEARSVPTATLRAQRPGRESTVENAEAATVATSEREH